ncbi:fimbrial protein [Pseudomonas sp. 7SR1]|uniref:fimbrial protein n=1 Tax=Pseudomonas sp. 7SR1 TaxID=1881017 RepID=UPI000953804D|nr:fimbrial protein [Pseudomonas sp. 7SR1]ROO34128.1 hypothetical protein BIV09_22340 [Pseudomonas sp. 7SR1]SIS26484.1 Fimbrial protein [Pseudomonas sp. 7SR1]
MNKAISILAALSLSFNVSESKAQSEVQYTCDNTYTHATTQALQINASVTIPDSAPAGTVVWRMPAQDLNYNCWLGPSTFATYFFLNPLGRDFGPDIEVGVTLNGTDYRPSVTKSVRARTMPTNSTSVGQINVNEFGYYKASLFILKKTAASTTSQTRTVDLNNYVPYTIGKEGQPISGLLSVVVKGLTANLIPCSSTVTVNPTTMSFGNIISAGATPGLEIKRATFSLFEQRTCQGTAVYGLNGILRPAENASLYDSMGTLVPKDNDSVGIEILDADNHTPLRFNNAFVVIPQVSSTSNSKQFEARLKWRTDKPKLGSFKAGAIFDVYYK